MMRIRRKSTLAAIICAAGSLYSGSAHGAVMFQGVGDLAGGTTFSSGLAVSGDGLTTVGSSNSANGAEAFSYTTVGGMVGQGTLNNSVTFTSAKAVSQDGTVIVGTGFDSVGNTVAIRRVAG